MADVDSVSRSDSADRSDRSDNDDNDNDVSGVDMDAAADAAREEEREAEETARAAEEAGRNAREAMEAEDRTRAELAREEARAELAQEEVDAGQTTVADVEMAATEEEEEVAAAELEAYEAAALADPRIDPYDDPDTVDRVVNGLDHVTATPMGRAEAANLMNEHAFPSSVAHFSFDTRPVADHIADLSLTDPVRARDVMAGIRDLANPIEIDFTEFGALQHEHAAIAAGTRQGALDAAAGWAGDMVDGVVTAAETAGQAALVGVNEVPIVELLVSDEFAAAQAADLQQKAEAALELLSNLDEVPQAIIDKYEADIALADALEQAYREGRADLSILQESARVRSQANTEMAILGAELGLTAAGGAGLGVRATRMLGRLDADTPGGLLGSLRRDRDVSATMTERLREFIADESGALNLGRELGVEPPADGILTERWYDRLNEGVQFNRDNWDRYEFNEVYLDNGTRVDSINITDGAAEIVSRKHTQLAEVQPSTALSYLNELATKYPPGARIADTPGNQDRPGTAGQPIPEGTRLGGPQILEVPVQNGPIPQAILDRANDLGIIIRDVEGREYN